MIHRASRGVRFPPWAFFDAPLGDLCLITAGAIRDRSWLPTRSWLSFGMKENTFGMSRAMERLAGQSVRQQPPPPVLDLSRAFPSLAHPLTPSRQREALRSAETELKSRQAKALAPVAKRKESVHSDAAHPNCATAEARTLT